MNRKGFTLVELMAIVIITGTIAILSFASLTSTIQKNKIREKETFDNNLITAAKLYIVANSDKYESLDLVNGRASISTEELIKSGYLKSNLSNPTGISISSYLVIVNNDDDGFLKYSVISKDDPKSVNLIYEEALLNGAYPRITKDMLPVTYTNEGKTVTANIYDEWYKYADKKWANAVILKNNAKNKYKDLSFGTEVSNDDIQSYLVWVPRYRYQIFNSDGTYNSTPQSIKIVFENSKTNKSKGNNVGEFITHPGFTFGNKQLNGLWIGKFETSYNNDNLYITPNQDPSNYKNFSTFYNESKKFNDYISSGDAHISKTSEWTTMVYLSDSSYGINTEIARNSKVHSSTGCGSTNDTEKYSSTCTNEFGKNGITYPQSSTGNIYGIFDLNAGCGEYTMGFKKNSEGKILVGKNQTTNSGFNGELTDGTFNDGISLPDSKYYDEYINDTRANVCKRKIILGHSLCETEGWYNDSSSYVSGSIFILGGTDWNGISSGIHFMIPDSGTANDEVSYRMVLTIS